MNVKHASCETQEWVWRHFFHFHFAKVELKEQHDGLNSKIAVVLNYVVEGWGACLQWPQLWWPCLVCLKLGGELRVQAWAWYYTWFFAVFIVVRFFRSFYCRLVQFNFAGYSYAYTHRQKIYTKKYIHESFMPRSPPQHTHTHPLAHTQSLAHSLIHLLTHDPQFVFSYHFWLMHIT